MRKGYIVDDTKVKELLSKKDELLEFQKKNKQLIREHFLYINEKNKQNYMLNKPKKIFARGVSGVTNVLENTTNDLFNLINTKFWLTSIDRFKYRSLNPLYLGISLLANKE